MNMNLSLFNIKEKIRRVELDNHRDKIIIGGDSSLPFMSENDNATKKLFALEIPYKFDGFYPELLKQMWGTEDFFERVKKASGVDSEFLSIKFNVPEEELDTFLQNCTEIVSIIESMTNKPLILRGANNTDIDKKLIPALAEAVSKPSIIAFADEFSLDEIVPSIVKNNHILVLRSPIDINLAKELNILSTDKGLSPEKILIDPDMGGLGYGLEYGYSIIERIKQAGFDGDTMLNMPIIAFIGEESYKAKEAKSDKFDTHWGDYQTRAVMWEISAASAIISAGANLVVVWNPETIKTLKGLL